MRNGYRVKMRNGYGVKMRNGMGFKLSFNLIFVLFRILTPSVPHFNLTLAIIDSI
jgi:hypothetical protein